MAFNLSKTLSTAAATGLMLGAITACGGSKAPAESPATAPAADSAAPASTDSAAPAGSTSDSGAAAPEAKACCKGHNDCKGKGGCNANCPK